MIEEVKWWEIRSWICVGERSFFHRPGRDASDVRSKLMEDDCKNRCVVSSKIIYKKDDSWRNWSTDSMISGYGFGWNCESELERFEDKYKDVLRAVFKRKKLTVLPMKGKECWLEHFRYRRLSVKMAHQ